MALSVTLYRADGKPHSLPDLAATKTAHSAVGGPRDAWAEGDGSVEGIGDLRQFLGLWGVFEDESTEARWWGRVIAARKVRPGRTIEVRLDEYANRVLVTYRRRDPLTEVETDEETAWAEDTDGQDRYGIKEYIEELKRTTPNAADQRADVVLAQRIIIPALPTIASGSEEERLELEFVGDWLTLAWQHYRYEYGRERNPKGSATIKIGQPEYTAATLGFFNLDNRRYFVYDTAAAMPLYQPGDRIKVSGGANDGLLLTVKAVTDGTARTHTGTDIGAESVFGARHLFDTGGHLQDIEAGEVVEITGFANGPNNGPKYVEENMKRAARATTNGFDFGVLAPSDQRTSYLEDIGNGGLGLNRLGIFGAEDIMLLTGLSNSTDGYGRVVWAESNLLAYERPLQAEGGATDKQLSAGNTLLLSEGSLEEEDPGASVTVKAGRMIEVEEAVTTEAASANITAMLTSPGAATSFTPGANFVMEYTVGAKPTSGTLSILFRYVDANNYWELRTGSGGSLQLFERTAGVSNVRRNSSSGIVSAGTVVRVETNGTSISGFVNNVAAWATYTSASHQSATGGMVSTLGTGGSVTSLTARRYTLPTLRPYAQKLAQSFVVNGPLGWNAGQVTVRGRKVGTHTDPLTLSLHSDSSGAPGSALVSVSVLADDITSKMSEIAADFQDTAVYALAAGGTYWLVVERGGTAAAANTYEIEVDEGAGYASGLLKVLRGSAWSEYDLLADEDDLPAADLVFGISGTLPAVTLIEEVLADAQFITGVESDVAAANSAQAEVHRPDYQDMRSLVEELLAAGTIGGKRMLAPVSLEGVARIYEEPDPDEAPFTLTADNRLKDAQDNILRHQEETPAVWVGSSDPLSDDDGELLLEGVEVRFSEDGQTTVQRQWRGQPLPWEV